MAEHRTIGQLQADAKKPNRKTIAELETCVAELSEALTNARDAAAADRRLRNETIDREKETRAQFADLKERLATADQLNSEMRGYLKRVQEDDVVREELVPIGDPQGEQQLVPKRRPTPFTAPTPYSQFGGEDTAMAYTRFRGEKPKPRHWVTY